MPSYQSSEFQLTTLVVGLFEELVVYFATSFKSGFSSKLMLEISTYSNLLLWLSFILCLVLTMSGIALTFRLGQIKLLPALPFLQYFLILLYVFGYYSLWSDIFFSRFLAYENINNLISIITQMGIPFFVISLVMLLIWASKIQERSPYRVVALTLLVSLVVIFAFLKWGWTVIDPVRAAYSLMGFITLLVVLTLIATGSKLVLKQKWRNTLIMLFTATSLLYLSYLSQLSKYEYYEAIFVFLFFFLNTAAIVLYLYTAEVEQTVQAFDDFVAKYNISKRETDIIQGIYAGSTNQEIADSLFITLQTVKDHSSRIYQKTYVKNRGQLTSLLRDST